MQELPPQIISPDLISFEPVNVAESARKKGLVRLKDKAPQIEQKIKYATPDNFTGKQLYEDGTSCWVTPEIAKKLIAVDNDLRKIGYSVGVWDCYRPQEVQNELIEAEKDPNSVAQGVSKHTRMKAFDVYLRRLDGEEIALQSDLDDFKNREYDSSNKYSKLLRMHMKKHGFSEYNGEWWHFSISMEGKIAPKITELRKSNEPIV
jgi:zinc D-Ala-D-Ala dipeptidase